MVRITVISLEKKVELVEKYLGEDCEKCPIFQVGQIFDLVTFDKPSTFCVWAWQDIFYAVHTIWNGGTFRPWYKEDGVAVVTCTDATRPVTFEIKNYKDEI